jgi:hypothetical protein
MLIGNFPCAVSSTAFLSSLPFPVAPGTLALCTSAKGKTQGAHRAESGDRTKNGFLLG